MGSSNLLEERDVDSLDGADFISDTGPRLPKDKLRERLVSALIVSVLFNAAIWTLVAQVVRTHLVAQLPPATFKRIILTPQPKPPKQPKVVPKIVPPKSKPLPIPAPQPVKTPVPPPPVHHAQTPPPAQHNRVLTATGRSQSTATVQPGGTAPVGKPIGRQAPDQPQQPTPAPDPAPAPVQQPPAPAPPTPPSPAPKPTPTGPTQDAQPSNQVYPEIPSDLESDDYQSFVRVKVDLAADGTFTVVLVSSSGNEEVDEKVLEALKKWKWSPALTNGTPIASTERFRFNFVVQ